MLFLSFRLDPCAEYVVISTLKWATKNVNGKYLSVISASNVVTKTPDNAKKHWYFIRNLVYRSTDLGAVMVNRWIVYSLSVLIITHTQRK